MIILGIDPGIAIVGWGVVETKGNRLRALGYGSIQTPKEKSTSARLAMIYAALDALIARYHPTELAVEELFWNTNVTTGIRVAEARGVVLLCAEQRGLRMQEYTPMQIKMAVSGYGKADKKQVIAMVTTLLNLPKPPKPDDTADALAAAITHAHSAGSALAQYYNLP